MHSPEFEIVPARETNLAVEIVEAKLVNDEYAIKVFLDVYKNTSAHTVRSYKKECLRFLLWLHTRYPAQPCLLPNVTNEDSSDYLDFLGNPAPFSADFLKAHGWKHQPFRKALDPESRKHCVTVLNKMFTTLRNIRATGNQPYCLFNPVADAAKINRRNKSPDEEYQSLTPEEWQAILDTIEDLPPQINSGNQETAFVPVTLIVAPETVEVRVLAAPSTKIPPPLLDNVKDLPFRSRVPAFSNCNTLPVFPFTVTLLASFTDPAVLLITKKLKVSPNVLVIF